MRDSYIPYPAEARYRPRGWNQGEREAEENGNPYPWNSPSWHVWNDGYQAAVSKVVSRMVGLSDKPRNGVRS